VPEYPRVQVDELSDMPNPTAHKKEVDEALGASAVGFNVYVARPGERLPWGYHYHPDREELLYVLEGELEVETTETPETHPENVEADEPAEEDEWPNREPSFHVGAGEALLIPAGAPQCTRAVGESSTRVIAVGAPKDADSTLIEEYCPACEDRTDRTYESRDEDGEPIYMLSCVECGTETDQFGAGPE
jgi:mannose-6-phosphate isomerase-like protein (cupin superfamily)